MFYQYCSIFISLIRIKNEAKGVWNPRGTHVTLFEQNNKFSNGKKEY